MLNKLSKKKKFGKQRFYFKRILGIFQPIYKQLRRTSKLKDRNFNFKLSFYSIVAGLIPCKSNFSSVVGDVCAACICST